MARIGVMGAMAEEIALLRQDLEPSSEAVIGMRTYASGRLYGCEAVLVFSRYGKVAAAATATTLIETFRIDRLVFTGVAGAAESSLQVGDIIVADRLVQHDVDARALGLARFEVPLLGQVDFPVAAADVEQALASAEAFVRDDLADAVPANLRQSFGITTPKVHVGTIASGDQFIADSRRIAELRRAIPNLLCVEMEGGAVAQVCHEHQVPFQVIRVISDRADESAGIDFSRFAGSIASPFTRGAIRRLVRSLGEQD